MSDFQFANADELNNLGSASVRYKQNIEALTILRALKENEGSTPSEAELKNPHALRWLGIFRINQQSLSPIVMGRTNQRDRSFTYRRRNRHIYAAQV